MLVLLGLACVAVALWTAPWLLRAYGWLARSMLEPAGQVEMAQRVRHLAQTRTETIDSGAAAMRQIEAGPARRGAGPAGGDGHDAGRRRAGA